MGDVMGPLSYPPWREGETLPPYPPLQIPPHPCRERGPGGTPNRRTIWYGHALPYTIELRVEPLEVVPMATSAFWWITAPAVASFCGATLHRANFWRPPTLLYYSRINPASRNKEANTTKLIRGTASRGTGTEPTVVRYGRTESAHMLSSRKDGTRGRDN